MIDDIVVIRTVMKIFLMNFVLTMSMNGLEMFLHHRRGN